jgi:hypothetical protein
VFALEQFQALGIDFVSITQSIDTSGPMGKLVFSVLAAIAEFERELIRESVGVGMKEAPPPGKTLWPARRRNLALRKLRSCGKVVYPGASLLRPQVCRLISCGHGCFQLKAAAAKKGGNSIADSTDGRLAGATARKRHVNFSPPFAAIPLLDSPTEGILLQSYVVAGRGRSRNPAP